MKGCKRRNLMCMDMAAMAMPMARPARKPPEPRGSLFAA